MMARHAMVREANGVESIRRYNMGYQGTPVDVNRLSSDRSSCNGSLPPMVLPLLVK